MRYFLSHKGSNDQGAASVESAQIIELLLVFFFLHNLREHTANYVLLSMTSEGNHDVRIANTCTEFTEVGDESFIVDVQGTFSLRNSNDV
jgi:hypothetical protein